MLTPTSKHKGIFREVEVVDPLLFSFKITTKIGKYMATNIGKVFESNWKKSIPQNILYYRPPDAAQSFSQNNNLRFSQHSPCDCILFNGDIGKLYCLELKTVKSNSISFERTKEDKGVIHKYQFESLEKFSIFKNVISGFILDFRTSDNTYFVEINDILNMINKIEKKSFNEKDLLEYCSPIQIEKQKLRVNYKYNILKFMEDVENNNEKISFRLCKL